MVQFRFSVLDEEHPLDGSELGHMEVFGSSGTASSLNAPGQPMLIHVSLCLLLDGLRPVIRAGRGSFTFDAVGCPFSLAFKARKNGPLVISTGRTVIDESPLMTTATALWSATQELLDPRLEEFPPYEAVTVGLKEALSKYREALESGPRKSLLPW